MEESGWGEGVYGWTKMATSWVREEMAGVDLKDKRLNERLCEVLSLLGGHPEASIPAACGGHAELVAAYRLFGNPKATMDSILRPHAEATRRRLAEQPLVLLVQDTTELDLTRPGQVVEGTGPLASAARRGVFLHPLHAFTPDGTPLGTLGVKAWTRGEEVRNAKRSRAERAVIPIEEKESHRWIEMMGRCGEEAKRCPSTKFICLADSEADIYEMLAAGMDESHGANWIIRACQDRALQTEAGHAKNAEDYVCGRVLAEPVLFKQTIHVRGRRAKFQCEERARRQPRESREAEVEVRAVTVTLRPPWRVDRRLSEVTLHVVHVQEQSPPEGDEAVRWVLLTSLPIDHAWQVREVIQFYCARWMIEILFRVLKSGCRVEKRRFEHIDRMLPCVGVYLIVAWRTLYVCRLGRSCPEVNCEAIFEPGEWKPVWRVVTHSDPPSQPPTLAVMVRLVAQLGGYINKKNRPDPPGPQTVWIGLQRTQDFAACWATFGPEARQGP